MIRHTLIGLLLAGVTLTASAEVKTGHKAAAEAKDDDVICTYERPLGSHIRKRVCSTKSQRAAAAARDRETMERMKQPQQAGGSPGAGTLTR